MKTVTKESSGALYSNLVVKFFRNYFTLLLGTFSDFERFTMNSHFILMNSVLYIFSYAFDYFLQTLLETVYSCSSFKSIT